MMWLDTILQARPDPRWWTGETFRLPGWRLIARHFGLWRPASTAVRLPRVSPEWLRRHEIEAAKHRDPF